jgi:uncharacterized membrane protein YeaQ/YmgE (transglycosylase-associated protein family)
MIPPYLLLLLILGAIYGIMFHLWRGKTFKDLAIYLVAGIIGFIIGQAIGNLLGLQFFSIGPLHIVAGTLLSWLSLFVAQWLKI